MSIRLADVIAELPAKEQPAQTMIFEADGLYVKQIAVPKAHTIMGQHAHQLSHLTMVARGAVRLRRGHLADAAMDEGEEYHAPTGIFIPAGELHSFETLVDGTVLYCIHAVGTPEALKILAEHGLTK